MGRDRLAASVLDRWASSQPAHGDEPTPWGRAVGGSGRLLFRWPRREESHVRVRVSPGLEVAWWSHEERCSAATLCYTVGMARANRELIVALRATAKRLEAGAPYRWTHMGACNCGHLAQTVTRLTAQDIRRYALERRGEWAEQGLEYCPTSGYPMDAILSALFGLGLSSDDLGHLERLSHPAVLRRLPVELRRELSYRERDHVVLYMRAFADLLQEQIPDALEGQLVELDPVRRVA